MSARGRALGRRLAHVAWTCGCVAATWSVTQGYLPGRVADAAAPRPAILRARGDSLRVQLVDAATSRRVANADVEVFSDNGIRCATAPCPTDGRTWRGRTDARGRVVLPRHALNVTASIGTPSHDGDLIADSAPDGRGGWVVRMTAKDDTAGMPERAVHLARRIAALVSR
jgi:hypothetical protein